MTPTALHTLLASAFAADPPRHADERELQERIAVALARATGIPGGVDDVTREHRLDARSRPDFLVWTGAATGIAVEVKIAGSPQDVLRQLLRYAEHPAVSGVLLVTTRSRHRGIVPAELLGKPAACLCIADYLL